MNENKEVMRRLIDAVYFVGKQELAFRGHNKSHESLNKGNYIEFLLALEQYYDILRKHFSGPTAFVGTSPQVQNDLIFCISKVMAEKIRDEPAGTNFVAVELGECPDVSKCEQLSLVYRYISNFKACERFVEFIECRSERNAQSIASIAISKIEQYMIGSKLVAQTYDGASVMAGESSGD